MKIKACVWWLTARSALWVVFVALEWGWDGCDSLHAFKTFLFCPPSLKKIDVNLKGTDHNHARHIASPKAILTCGAQIPHVTSKAKPYSLMNTTFHWFFLVIIWFYGSFLTWFTFNSSQTQDSRWQKLTEMKAFLSSVIPEFKPHKYTDPFTNS